MPCLGSQGAAILPDFGEGVKHAITLKEAPDGRVPLRWEQRREWVSGMSAWLFEVRVVVSHE